MQPDSRFATSLSEEIGVEKENATSSIQIQNQPVPKITTTTKSKRRGSKTDTISASVVVGMTAQFVVFILCLVTEFVPRIIDTILLSLFVGICVGVIGFALMKGND
jgi:preprotein translocase subunit SecF